MNKLSSIKNLSTIANILDNMSLYKEATSITNIMAKIAQIQTNKYKAEDINITFQSKSSVPSCSVMQMKNVDADHNLKTMLPMTRVRASMNASETENHDVNRQALSDRITLFPKHLFNTDLFWVGGATEGGDYLNELFHGYNYDELVDGEVFALPVHDDYYIFELFRAATFPVSHDNNKHIGVGNRLLSLTRLQAQTELMSVGASQVHQATINSQGKLEFSRDANRDLNFTWHLGLQLAVALNIQNYSGVILANRKQHLPSTISAKWQHVFVWAHGAPQECNLQT
jgi:hypothetical protein